MRPASPASGAAVEGGIIDSLLYPFFSKEAEVAHREQKFMVREPRSLQVRHGTVTEQVPIQRRDTQRVFAGNVIEKLKRLQEP